eukprot:12651-Prymnesium_polylepis.1
MRARPSSTATCARPLRQLRIRVGIIERSRRQEGEVLHVARKKKGLFPAGVRAGKRSSLSTGRTRPVHNHSAGVAR